MRLRCAALPARWRAALPALCCAVLPGCSDILTEPFRYGTVEVLGERRSGEAVPGVEFTLYTGTRTLGVDVTDELGRILFRFVPACGMGVSAWEQPEPYRSLDPESGTFRTFTMVEGEERSFTFVYLKVGPGTIVVRVVDPEGAGIPGVRVQRYAPDGAHAEAETDHAGEHAFTEVPFGHHGVRLLPGRGYLIPDEGSHTDGLLIDDGATEHAMLTELRCRGVVRAVVVDEGESPVANVPVTLYGATGFVGEGVTDAEGIREFEEVACGNYGVGIGEVRGYRFMTPAAGFVDGLELGPNGLLTARFTLVVCRGVIEVRVQDAGGAPVPTARLILYNPQEALAVSLSGADGSVAFEDVPLAPSYGVRVDPPDGYHVVEGRGTSYLDGVSIEDGSVEQLTFTVTADAL